MTVEPKPAEITPVEASPQERRITVIALMIVLLMSAMDQNVVGTAMPRIVAQFQGLNLYSWITTIYLLTSTVTVPIWGKLGDLFGRKGILLVGTVVFLAGSWLCGLAGEIPDLPFLHGGMVQLIAARGLQGVGGGALFTSAFAVMADLYPPRERGKLSGYFGGMFGVAALVGPVLGGALTDYATTDIGGFVIEGWRWCFYVNLPLGLLALFMIWTKTPALKGGRGGRVDFLGALLLVTAFVPLLLALSGRGGENEAAAAWSSQQLLILYGVFGASLLLFLITEWLFPEPILPLGLFKTPVFTWSNIAAFIVNMAFMGVMLFVVLYLQLGLGVPPARSGIAMLPLLFGLIGAAIISGRLVTKTGRYKPMMIAGGLCLVGGLFLLTRIDAHTSLVGVMVRMFVLGIGLGPSQGLYSVAIQNAVPMERIGVATSSSQFFRQIGATVGAAIFGAIMNQSLSKEMLKVGTTGGHPMSFYALQQMFLKNAMAGHHAKALVLDPPIRAAFAAAMADVFMAGLVIAIIGFVVTLFIPELPLRSRLPGAQKAEPLAEPGEGVVAGALGEDATPETPSA
ncbi:MAG TPA: MDR family MFS transporter [Caulobacteraceae bacterium]|jgi:EmrB/QacA subfamily drug resistance transporter|nr:MDR family MFS transporter [Caulobacteraceae bacterium]